MIVYGGRVDPLDRFLGGPRASRAFALLMRMDRPWGLDVRDGAALTVVAVIDGAARIDGVLLSSGDVALVKGPEPYVVTDTTGSPPSIEIGRGQLCRSLDGRDLSDELRLGVRRWGNAAEGETTLLVGTYDRPDEVGDPALLALPRLAVVPRAATDGAVTGMLAHELAQEGAAGQVVIDRLLDVLVVSTVRRWSEISSREEDSWLTCSDPVVVAALGHLHADPAAPWTVAELARRVRVSRASFASRFRAGVGRPPMAYLTRWRLTLAGDLLLDPDLTVAAVARAVGYDNPYAFSTAFKREVGVSPSEFRKRRPQLS